MSETVEPGQVWQSRHDEHHYVRVERRWLPSDMHPGDEWDPGCWWVETCDSAGNVNGQDRYVAEASYFGGIYSRVQSDG